MKRLEVLAFAFVFVVPLGVPVPAFAQGAGAEVGRTVLGGTVFRQSAAAEMIDRFTFPSAGQTASVQASFTPSDSAGLEASMALRVWRRLGASASASFYAPSANLARGGQVVSRIPHPFVADAHREVAFPADLKRTETAVHANLLYFIDASPRLRIALGGGPSFFFANQAFVTGIEHQEDTPVAPTTVTVTGVGRVSDSASGVGLNGSADVLWALHDHLGIGALLRYSRATVTFEPTGRAVEARVGGFQAGAGLHFMF